MTGVAVLAASIIRRDLLKTLAWVVAIVVLMVYAVATYQSTYGSPEEIAGYARVVAESPAARAFSGPGYGLLAQPNLGAVTANETVSFLAIAIALMSIFHVVRNTRAEEEDGRAELLASRQISRHGRTWAAMVVDAALCAAVGLVLCLLLLAFGLSLAGSLAFGAALAGCGVFFGALALVAAQLSVHARVANAIAGGALGVAYLVRALGDMSDTGLSWLSPIGWAQAVRPFATERPAALIPLFAGAAALVAVALTLEGRRDLGAGMIGSRPGPAEGRPYLSHPLGIPLRTQRTAILGWLVGAVVLGITYGSFTDEIEQMLRESPGLADYLAQTGGSLVDSYLVTVLLILALVASGFAIQSLLRIRAEEIAGRAEISLATSLSRRRWLGGYLAITAVGVCLMLLLGGAMVGFGYLISGADADQIARLAAIGLAWAPAVLVVAGLALAVIAYLPRFSQAAWALLGLFSFLAFFGDPLGLPQWLRDLSPFEHASQAPAEPFSILPTLALAVAALLLAGASLARFERRDIS